MIELGPQSLISILAMTLIGSAAWLALLPVGTCRECPHCRLERIAKERERAADVGHGFSPFCPVCGRRHRPDEDHPI
jgi:hypothetical protein